MCQSLGGKRDWRGCLDGMYFPRLGVSGGDMGCAGAVGGVYCGHSESLEEGMEGKVQIEITYCVS